jgi:hypothetical protein
MNIFEYKNKLIRNADKTSESQASKINEVRTEYKGKSRTKLYTVA